MVQNIVNVSGQENGQRLSYGNSTGGIPGSADHAAVHRAFQAADHESLIRAAVEASPNKIAIVAVKGPYDHPGWHASDLDPAGFDHVAVAYYDARTQSYKLAEMVPSATLTETGKEVIANTGSPTLGAMLGSENKPGDIAKLSWDYADVAAVPVNLGPEQAGEFLKAVLEKTAPGNTYSFVAAKFFGGETCASSIAQAIRYTLDPHFGISISLPWKAWPTICTTISSWTSAARIRLLQRCAAERNPEVLCRQERRNLPIPVLRDRHLFRRRPGSLHHRRRPRRRWRSHCARGRNLGFRLAARLIRHFRSRWHRLCGFSRWPGREHARRGPRLA